jgi:hypothetical protein
MIFPACFIIQDYFILFLFIIKSFYLYNRIKNAALPAVYLGLSE